MWSSMLWYLHQAISTCLISLMLILPAMFVWLTEYLICNTPAYFSFNICVWQISDLCHIQNSLFHLMFSLCFWIVDNHSFEFLFRCLVSLPFIFQSSIIISLYFGVIMFLSSFIFFICVLVFAHPGVYFLLSSLENGFLWIFLNWRFIHWKCASVASWNACLYI